jgi:glutamate 5-kinase
MHKTFQTLAKQSKVIVIKVGSNILVNEKYKLRKKWLNSLVEDVAKLQKKGSKIIIVSSGAIALGRDVLKKKKLTNLHEKQAAASIGQIQLSQHWQRTFAKLKIQSSQILITAEDLNERRKYLNIRNTIYSLMDLNVIPIINENDTTSTEEIRFGDNDKLSAMIANALSAELLILLSDVNGLYTSNPKKSSDAKLLTSISEIDPTMEKYIDQDLSEFGSGGMLAKINAAKLCMQSGSTMIISNGLVDHPVRHIHPKNPRGFIQQRISSLVVSNGSGIDLSKKQSFILMKGPRRL